MTVEPDAGPGRARRGPKTENQNAVKFCAVTPCVYRRVPRAFSVVSCRVV